MLLLLNIIIRILDAFLCSNILRDCIKIWKMGNFEIWKIWKNVPETNGDVFRVP